MGGYLTESEERAGSSGTGLQMAEPVWVLRIEPEPSEEQQVL